MLLIYIIRFLTMVQYALIMVKNRNKGTSGGYHFKCVKILHLSTDVLQGIPLHSIHEPQIFH